MLIAISRTGFGRVQLAQTLLGMLPSELAAFSEPEEQATEYLHYRQFFTIWDTLARVVEYQALEVSQMNRERKLAWLVDYRVCSSVVLGVGFFLLTWFF